MCTVISPLDWASKTNQNWPLPYWNPSTRSKVTEKSLLGQLICTTIKLIWPYHWKGLAQLCQIDPLHVKINWFRGSSTTQWGKKSIICTFRGFIRPNQWLSWQPLNPQDAFYYIFKGQLNWRWDEKVMAIFFKTLWKLSVFIESFSGKFKGTQFFAPSYGFQNGKAIHCGIKIDWAVTENSCGRN